MNLEYECHITLAENKALVETWEALAPSYGWKTSFIVGDPLLGKKGFFYFTCHTNDIEEMFDKMRHMVKILKMDSGAQVVREKIELIVYDTKNKLLPGYAHLTDDVSARQAFPRNECRCSDTLITQSWLHALGCPEYAPQFINGG